MALGISPRVVNDHNLKIKVVDLTLDGSYAAGGYSLAPSALGLQDIWGVCVVGGNAPAGIVGHYNHSTGKLQLFGSAATNQNALSELAANSAQISGATVMRLVVFGA